MLFMLALPLSAGILSRVVMAWDKTLGSQMRLDLRSWEPSDGQGYSGLEIE